MKRTLATILLFFSLAACTATMAPSPSRQDLGQNLFFKGLNELLTGETSPSLNELAKAPRRGIWQQRAQILLDWQARVRTREHADTAGLLLKLRACRADNDQLSQKNAKLDNDLQELKTIMIEMEKRSK